ncbi:5-amino-6-(5-phosphoribosylamino)uracil reductase [candidate division MSBL1 archaeon SCGC-AAA259E19]|uniref:2,5-diamino-6-(ribosylamino)-4(3H)-pyrimidinone 5'-phosphate reductase n=1 Tax=candidate division MSBL1 archaeon SCGC-AAA259E19 TaxID=1698264 RepID=A0A133ULN5_9EURY|nr:5-amino-6-(5-phosphoribosylamino)uracil reductase [candidate division MSBL1 archaeon SCGC-AAA259E19]
MKRPYVILNAAMTLDGKISSLAGDSRISCKKDLDRTHKLRAEVDGVMVGIGTILADDPSLTVRRVSGKNPVRIIVDSRGRTPPEARVLEDTAPTIVAVSNKAGKRDIEGLRSLGARVIVTGKEDKVDLNSLLKEILDQEMEKILLEGGSTLNWGMLNQGLVDEVRIAVRPCIIGGENAKTLVGGRGFDKIEEGVELELKNTERVGSNLLLIYNVKGASSCSKK